MKVNLAAVIALSLCAGAGVGGCLPALTPTPTADESPPVAALVAKGMPAPDHVWSSDDYTAALTALENLGKADPRTLPRLGSPRSGVVFARIVSAENVAFLGEELATGKPPQLGQAGVLMGNLGKILGVYVKHATPRASFDSEVVEITSFMLSFTKDLFLAGDRVIQSIPASDPHRETRVAGFAKMRHGLGSIVSGSLSMLTERSLYRAAPRLQMAQALLRELPGLYPYLLPEVQQKLPGQLSKVLTGETDEGIQKALHEIQAVVTKAAAGS